MDKDIGIGAYYESSTIENGQTIKKFNATIRFGNQFSRLDAKSFDELEIKVIKKTKEIITDANKSR